MSLYTPAILVSLLCSGCCLLSTGQSGGTLSKPQQAIVSLDTTLTQALKQPEARQALYRYFAASPAWEIRKARHKTFAVRLEKQRGVYQASLNGFYSEHQGKSFRQRRVIFAFDRPHGFGRDYGQITRVDGERSSVQVTIEGPHSGHPGYSSYLIVEGPSMHLEIFEQGPEQSRSFTQHTLHTVAKELQAVLAHKKYLVAHGVMPPPLNSMTPHAASPSFVVEDDFQGGIFNLRAHVNPPSKGVVFAKVFRSKDNQQLSAARLTPRSTRVVGWSKMREKYFPYTANVTVYEGDWSKKYKARFELWHKDEGGRLLKLAEVERMIHGWQQ